MIDEKKIGAAFFSATLSLVFTGYITAMISMSYMLQDAMSKIIFIEVFIVDFFPSTTTIVVFSN